MVLVDTSVWVSHFREGNPELVKLLDDGQVACHPFIIGEIACGSLKNRAKILSLLQALPTALEANHAEVLRFIESNKLMGKGLGYVDVHISASAKLTGVPLWTLDKRLNEANNKLGISYRC